MRLYVREIEAEDIQDRIVVSNEHLETLEQELNKYMSKYNLDFFTNIVDEGIKLSIWQAGEEVFNEFIPKTVFIGDIDKDKNLVIKNYLLKDSYVGNYINNFNSHTERLLRQETERFLKKSNIKEHHKVIKENSETPMYNKDIVVTSNDELWKILDDKNITFRGMSSENPMSIWGHAMFTDSGDNAYFSSDINDLYNSNRHAFFVDKSKLTDIDNIKDIIWDTWESDKDDGILEYKYGFDDDDINLSESELIDLFNPSDIVDNADGFDNKNFTAWFIDRIVNENDIAGIKTNDGAVVFDDMIIYEIIPQLQKGKNEKLIKKENFKMVRKLHLKESNESNDVMSLIKDIPEKDIDHWETDLYLRKTPETTKVISKLPDVYKKNVITFIDDIDHVPWYEIPFVFPKDRNRKGIKESILTEETEKDFIRRMATRISSEFDWESEKLIDYKYNKYSKEKAIDTIQYLLDNYKIRWISDEIHERSEAISTTDDPYEFENYLWDKIYDEALYQILDNFKKDDQRHIYESADDVETWDVYYWDKEDMEHYNNKVVHMTSNEVKKYVDRLNANMDDYDREHGWWDYELS